VVESEVDDRGFEPGFLLKECPDEEVGNMSGSESNAESESDTKEVGSGVGSSQPQAIESLRPPTAARQPSPRGERPAKKVKTTSIFDTDDEDAIDQLSQLDRKMDVARDDDDNG
jgi:hypothetical protein